ncbi:MAG: DUF4920 domain-containing protein [Chlorobi bacterium]|nr:DUF4920 domain-containing protein [Chlorobiota bacterium]
MKRYLVLISAMLIIASCQNSSNTQKAESGNNGIMNAVGGKVFGNKIANNDIRNAESLSIALENKDKKGLKLEGKVDAVCQMTGCWLNMDIGHGETVHVTFKDEAFTMPKDIAGRTAVIEGVASKEIITVDELKKAAKAEGKPQVEIDAITQAKAEYYFEAEGVTIK